MIPRSILSKTDTYDITINDVSVKARYLDDNDLVDSSIREMWSILSVHSPVVGIDLKKCSRSQSIQLLLIYAENRCLIIHLGRMSRLPPFLSRFLSHDEICFVGRSMSEVVDALKASRFCCSEDGELISGLLRSGVDIGYLAARLQKNRALQSCGSLAELASKIGYDFREEEDQNGVCPDWAAGCFSNEEVKYAMREAYHCYKMGRRVLNTAELKP